MQDGVSQFYGIPYPSFVVSTVQECGCSYWPCGHAPPVETHTCNCCGWKFSRQTCGDGRVTERTAEEAMVAVEYHSKRCKP